MGIPARKAAVPAMRFARLQKICATMSISGNLVRRPYEAPKGAGQTKEADDAHDGVLQRPGNQ
jgi:hypothetical protein